ITKRYQEQELRFMSIWQNRVLQINTHNLIANKPSSSVPSVPHSFPI
ncbi:hypothetical protein D027_0011B, partial [Vibrio parahaemolyticus 861]